MHKLINKKEIIIIVILIIVAVLGVLHNKKGGNKAEGAVGIIQCEGTNNIAVDLATPQYVELPSNPSVVIEVKADGSIGFVASDCPDKICVSTGFIKSPGKSAACLPNDVLLFVESESANQPDITI